MKPSMILLSSLLCLTICAHAAKSIDERIELREDQEVVLKLKFAESINVIPVNENILHVKGDIEINDGENDDAYSVEVENSQSSVIVQSHLEHDEEHYRIIQTFDKDGNLKSTSRSVDVKGHYNVEVPRSWKLSVKTINADINITNQAAPMKIESINGEIDFRFDQNDDLDLKVSTINGDCYTDTEFDWIGKRPKSYQVGRTKAQVRLNNGGLPIELKTINGFMYLRRHNNHHSM
ncbi:MAG: hypothetical protein MI748_06315 [Opitutales bacterium]|nr:hypothetical protein [Opitutales bacterium]